MNVVKATPYPHIYNANGTRRAEPCCGNLALRTDHSGTACVCLVCGEGWSMDLQGFERLTLAGRNVTGSRFDYDNVRDKRATDRS